MHITTLGTGSWGNGYILTDKAGHSLIIECGVKANEMLKALNYSVMDIDGAIISHAHTDHAGCVSQYEKYAIPIWKAWEEPSAMRVFGDFTVVSFELPHDDTENRGFVIRADNECIIYMTDMEFCPFYFRDFKPTVLMIECNHKNEYLDTEAVKYEHSIRGHASVEVTRGIVEANKTEALKAVILIHASRDGLDKAEALASISEVLDTKVDLCFAEKGKTLVIQEEQ